MFDPPTAAPYVQPFKEGLRDLGWIDGRTIQIIERYDNFDSTRHAQLATELVGLRVDLLYVTASAVPAARNATKTIPIVCPDSYDPILKASPRPWRGRTATLLACRGSRLTPQ